MSSNKLSFKGVAHPAAGARRAQEPGRPVRGRDCDHQLGKGA